VNIPRGYRWDAEIERIMQLRLLPREYADSPVWKNAHALYWQIVALKGDDPSALMWHPV
jgi:hypothetical protein